MKRKRRRESSYNVRLAPEQLEQLALELHQVERKTPAASPTVGELFERFQTWARAQRQKPSTLETKEALWRLHLAPHFEKKRATELAAGDVVALKQRLAKLSGKRVNNALAVLRKSLRLAVKRGELQVMPVDLEAVAELPGQVAYYDFETYEKLIDGAIAAGPRELAVVLLGGDAGLRMGEQLGLRRGDVDLRHRLLHVRRSDWRGHLVAPKSGRGRVVPMTGLLVQALTALFVSYGTSTRGDARVLQAVAGDVGRARAGEALSIQAIRTLMERAQRNAGLEVKGNLHVLRHTFCSHLAMRGASTRTIRDLAGHASISTTERYMHLADGEKTRAIGLLETGRNTRRPLKTEAAGTRQVGHATEALTPTRFELVGPSDQLALLELAGALPVDE